VFTALLAGLVFGEHLGPRVAIGAGVMALGGVALGWTSKGLGITAAAGVVALACLFWALDNNLTRLIADSDPLLIVEVKGLVAGSVNTFLAILIGESWPTPRTIGLGMTLGAVSYGTSLVLFILAMRDLGAARAGAYFATAPFFGAAGGLALGEPPTAGLLVAAALMAGATWLLVHERHSHRHRHEGTTHSHRHVHDAHHEHAHDGSEGPEPHDHPHPTGPLEHEHPHTPDIHHDHGHR
jgi:drug/metabolite transporter (DMT)-like permease